MDKLSECIDQAEELLGLMEDTVSYFCEEQMVSGQRVWVMIHALAEHKVSEFPEF